jgi:hypothetical protein
VTIPVHNLHLFIIVMPSTIPDFWYEMGDAIKAELQAQPEGQKKRPLNQRTIQEMLPPKKRVRGAGSSTDPIEFEEDDLVSGDQKKADQKKGGSKDGCPPGDLKAVGIFNCSSLTTDMELTYVVCLVIRS